MVGVVAYELDCTPLRATGYTLDGDAATEVAPTVRAILRDDAGVDEARQALADVTKTDFAIGVLENILTSKETYEEWRVGEALAEVHLTAAEGCTFPWPNSRSLRNPASSSGGVDLVGVHVGVRTRFVFAEVKTSHQQAWPPSVVTSRSGGLRGQLAGLMAGDDRFVAAMHYLIINGVGRSWLATVKDAMKTYFENQADVVLFGVLVHASDPQPADLDKLSRNLAVTHTDPTSSALIALYVSPELLTMIANGEIDLETAA